MHENSQLLDGNGRCSFRVIGISKGLSLLVKNMDVPEGGQLSQLPVLDLDNPCGGDAGPVQERGVLEGSRLLVSNIQTEGRI